MGFPGGLNSKESTCNARDMGREDPVEEGMATYSSILVWRIPGTEEPGSPWGRKVSDTAKQLNNNVLCAKLLQLCPTLCKPMAYSLPGSSVPGILQGIILEWDAVPSSRESSQRRG